MDCNLITKLIDFNYVLLIMGLISLIIIFILLSSPTNVNINPNLFRNTFHNKNSNSNLRYYSITNE